jgi:hypothetical protein
MAASTETYANHRKFVPVFHYVALPILLINVFVAAWQLIRMPALMTTWALLMAVALFLGVLYGRVFALKVQDRVIRLEERMRLRGLLGGDLQGRVEEFTTAQLIGLRFASDAELPELAAAVLRDRVTDREAIKKMVKQWRADEARA